MAEAKSDAHKTSLEHKVKWTTKDIMGGIETEFKVKNSGDLAVDCKCDALNVS